MKVGFIGLGLMGRGMAANLQKAGYAVVVHDLAREAASQRLAAGAEWAETPRDISSRLRHRVHLAGHARRCRERVLRA